jgi:hypothetical protein
MNRKYACMGILSLFVGGQLTVTLWSSFKINYGFSGAFGSDIPP